MASQTIAKILQAEQAAAEAVSQAEEQAGLMIGTARQEAQRYLEEESEKTNGIVASIAGQAQAEVMRLEGEAEQAAAAKAQVLRESALEKLETAQDLVISMIIPE